MTFINRFRTYAGVEFQSLKQYLANPTRNYLGKDISQNKLKRVFMLYGFFFLFLLLILPLLFILSSFSQIENQLKIVGIFDLVVIALITPVLEELVFRLGLRNIVYTLFIGPLVIAAPIKGNHWVVMAWFVATQVVLFVWFKFFVLKSFGKEKLGAKFAFGRKYIKAYKKVFWTYAALFASIHIGNYVLEDLSHWMVIFYIIPQFIMGLILGYLRIRDGMWSAIFFHVLNNSVIGLLLISAV
jgi:membrane protease YdiL (CAAX protease family)